MGPVAFGQDGVPGFPGPVGPAPVAWRHAQDQPAVVIVAQPEMPAIAAPGLILAQEHALVRQVVGPHPERDGALADLPGRCRGR